MSTGRAASLAVLALFAVLVAGVFLRPLLPVDETRYVAVAWEMHVNHNWFVPTKNFDLYTDKPPLLFWLINLAWTVAGVSDWAARLVGPLAAVISVLLTGRLAARLWPDDPEAGPRAVLALAGALPFVLLGGLTMFDALLTLCTVAGYLALLRALRGGLAAFVPVGIAIAFGVLAKGPVILLHLAPAMLLAPLWAEVAWRRALAGFGVALLSALVILAFWLVPALILGGPEYREAVLWTQSAGRIGGEAAPHAKPIWFFAALLPVLLFPWVLAPGLWRAALRTGWRGDRALRLALIWAGSAFVLFSLISGKQAHYLVPELPAVALIVARLTRVRPQFTVAVAVVPVALVGAAFLAMVSGLLDTGKAADLLDPLSALLGWVLLAVAICWLALRLGGLRGGVVLTLGLVASLNLLVGLTKTHTYYDARQVAALLDPYRDAGIAFTGQTYHAEFNFAARLTQPVAVLESDAARAAWEADHPGGVIISRPDRVDLGWPPAEVVTFRNSPYGIWRVADDPGQKTETEPKT
ncbi:ArnT family glycosyltransferase [Oceaniglobus roseus]|uniref:ArnT family glycosyltransferase n=1 Tax=Oceaniglobus roseus TaxID=1737570 RepID=UPI000C7E9C3C|nr:glycosyltransferase family 39 protein [Kandeliimicrobium roseum]